MLPPDAPASEAAVEWPDFQTVEVRPVEDLELRRATPRLARPEARQLFELRIQRWQRFHSPECGLRQSGKYPGLHGVCCPSAESDRRCWSSSGAQDWRHAAGNRGTGGRSA